MPSPNWSEVHHRAARSEDPLRLIRDAKAPVLVGPFSRGGKSRRGTKGGDDDFEPGEITPLRIFLPDEKELNFYFTSSKVTGERSESSRPVEGRGCLRVRPSSVLRD